MTPADRAIVEALTARQKQVFFYLMQGFSIGDIAEALGSKRNAAHSISVQVYKKFGISGHWRHALLILHCQPVSEDVSPIAFPLPPRQKAVLLTLLEGKAPKEIAAALNIRPNTMRHYLNEIYDASGMDSGPQLLLWLLARGGKAALEPTTPESDGISRSEGCQCL